MSVGVDNELQSSPVPVDIVLADDGRVWRQSEDRVVVCAVWIFRKIVANVDDARDFHGRNSCQRCVAGDPEYDCLVVVVVIVDFRHERQRVGASRVRGASCDGGGQVPEEVPHPPACSVSETDARPERKFVKSGARGNHLEDGAASLDVGRRFDALDPDAGGPAVLNDVLATLDVHYDELETADVFTNRHGNANAENAARHIVVSADGEGCCAVGADAE